MFGMRPRPGWPDGACFDVPGMRQRVVLLDRLPLRRTTTPLHLAGTAAQRDRALRAIRRLREDDPDRAPLLALAVRQAN